MIGEILTSLTRFLVGGQARWQDSAPSLRQRIYFANHSSHLDALVVWAALPAQVRAITHPVAARDYWSATQLRRFVATRVLNAVLIDRDCRHDPLEPLRMALARGHSLILFPEGTRGNAEIPARFKPGLHRLAHDYPQVELIPVYLTNLARAYPKGAIVPVPITCLVRFGAPLARHCNDTKRAFLERARWAVSALGDTS